MRIISGSAKGVQLKSVPGKSTRPITDRVKEALFNILGSSIVGKTILDLFGGTGAVGIEALSRGADHAVFLEINYKAYRTIQENLKAARLEPYATVHKKDAFIFLREPPQEPFDLVYIAPPQYEGLWLKAVLTLDENPQFLHSEGQAIVQIHPKEFEDAVEYRHLRIFDQREYGDTLLVFYERLSTE